MEAHGIPGEIQVTPATLALLKPNYNLEERGWINIKGKGLIQVHF
jgi:Amt family ammonium transporter